MTHATFTNFLLRLFQRNKGSLVREGQGHQNLLIVTWLTVFNRIWNKYKSFLWKAVPASTKFQFFSRNFNIKDWEITLNYIWHRVSRKTLLDKIISYLVPVKLSRLSNQTQLIHFINQLFSYENHNVYKSWMSNAHLNDLKPFSVFSTFAKSYLLVPPEALHHYIPNTCSTSNHHFA